MAQKQSSIPPPTEQDTPAQQNDPVPPANESRSIECDSVSETQHYLETSAIDQEQEQSSLTAHTEPHTPAQQTDPDPAANESPSLEHLLSSQNQLLLGILGINIRQGHSSIPAPTEPDTPAQQTDPDSPANENPSFEHLFSAQNQLLLGTLGIDIGQGQSSIPEPTEPDTPAQQTDPDLPAIEKPSLEHLLSTQKQLLLGTLGIDIGQGQTDPDPPAIDIPPLKVILKKLNDMDMCLHKDPWKNAQQWSYILANRTKEIIGCPVGSIMEMVAEAKTANEEIAKTLTKVNKDCGIVSVVNGSAGMGAGALCLTGVLLIPVTAGGSVGLSIAGMALGVTTAVSSLGASVAKSVIKTTQQHKLNAKTKALQQFQRLLKLSMEAITNSVDSEEYRRQQLYASVELECEQEVTYMDSICIKEEKVGATTHGNNPLNLFMEYKDEIWPQCSSTISGNAIQVRTIVKMIKVIKAQGVAHKSLHSLMGVKEVTLPFKIAGHTAITAGSMGAKVLTSSVSAVTIGMSAWEIKNGVDAIKNPGDTKLVKHYLERSEKLAKETERLVQLYYKLKECCQESQHKIKH